ncbi:class I SAM-dependent methyltransferase [Singulisphaera sp. PoT]|uniref:class I SAM-dependent methyltransferase n=1 Tax=Singulisphaera sp. PoT TaxID=3411797 RepID=UPI003BF55AFF
MSEHDRALSVAFDGQAQKFERAPVQSDPAALARLVQFAGLAPDSYILDAGCGPGLVSTALLQAGHRVFGVDLSAEMIARARTRGEPFGDRAQFSQTTVFDPSLWGPFDATISRYVLHHVTDPAEFLFRQVELLRPGGVVILCDHTTDPDRDRARHHQEIEKARDSTHTLNLTPGAIIDLFASAGLFEIQMVEETFTLDFDEWFDRGTPSAPKAEVRDRIVNGPQARGYHAVESADGSVTITCQRSLVRGRKPTAL